MKLITIFNFPDNENYNNLCHWWLQQALINSDLDVEIWYYDNIKHLHYIPEIWNERVKMLQKPKLDISNKLPSSLVSDKSKHNVGFKLYNLCEETEPFIFVDADAIILKNVKPLIEASKRKPVIMIDHQSVPGHTAHLSLNFLNSGVQIVSNPSLLNFEAILQYQSMYGRFICPGTDQAMLYCYFYHIGYNYRDSEIGYEWNNCAGLNSVDIDTVCINHYWYNFKPWQINCPLWKEFLRRIK